MPALTASASSAVRTPLPMAWMALEAASAPPGPPPTPSATASTQTPGEISQSPAASSLPVVFPGAVRLMTTARPDSISTEVGSDRSAPAKIFSKSMARSASESRSTAGTCTEDESPGPSRLAPAFIGQACVAPPPTATSESAPSGEQDVGRTQGEKESEDVGERGEDGARGDR